MFALADRLRERRCSVHMVLGAASEARLFGVLEARRAAQSVSVLTEDGSVGQRGRVTDALPALLTRTRADVVYACGPMGMLRAVARLADEHGAHSQCAVEEAMACGVGVCMTCVLPVDGDDGITRMVRSCVEGPVFRGERVHWDAVGTIPEGTLGAPRTGGH
jgi:dihydroorotate dehydrogenase electron transfer subunit